MKYERSHLQKVFFVENKIQIVTLELPGGDSSSINCHSFVDSLFLYRESDRKKTKVIPGKVNESSIMILESVNGKFKLIWDGVEDSVSDGVHVSYEVLIDVDRTEELLFKADSPFIENIELPKVFCWIFNVSLDCPVYICKVLRYHYMQMFRI